MGGGQGRCERRSEVFAKFNFFFLGGGVRLDMNGEVKFFENSKKKNWGGGGGEGWMGG